MATLAARMALTAAEQMGIAIRMIVGRIAPLRHAVTTRARKTSKNQPGQFSLMCVMP